MRKLLTLALVFTSLIAYIEWSGNHAFLWQLEWAYAFLQKGSTYAFLNPFIFVPLLGQLLLLITLFQKKPAKVLNLIGFICLSAIMLFVFITGVIGLNMCIALSVVPFIIVAILSIYYNR